VCADNNETVAESNESNNCLTNLWALGYCGDVTGDDHIRVSDGLRIIENQTFIGDPRYAVDPWAADVTGDGYVRVSDGLRIIENQTFIGDPRYKLTCRCSEF